MDDLGQLKKASAELFLDQLRKSRIWSSIAKVILFGSVAIGRARESSDVDLLVIALGNLDAVRDACFEAQLGVWMQHRQPIEYLVYPLEALRRSNSLFLSRVLRDGIQIYSMDQAELIRRESQGYLELAREFLQGAQLCLSSGLLRLAIDAAYNSIELCAKALILLAGAEIPSSHGGILAEFGRIYIIPGKLPRELGKKFSASLELRSRARYELSAELDSGKAQEMIQLAQEFIQILSKQLNL